MSFEFNRAYNSIFNIDAIQFRAFREYHSMSVTQFSILVGLYDEAFTNTKEYEQLPMDYPSSLTPQRAQKALCEQGQYESGTSKATCLS